MSSIFRKEIKRFTSSKNDLTVTDTTESKPTISELKEFAKSYLPNNLIYDYAVFDWDVSSYDYEIPEDIPIPDSWLNISGLSTVVWFDHIHDYPILKTAQKLTPQLKNQGKNSPQIYTDLVKGLALLSAQICPDFFNEEDPELPDEWIAAQQRKHAETFSQLAARSLP